MSAHGSDTRNQSDEEAPSALSKRCPARRRGPAWRSAPPTGPAARGKVTAGDQTLFGSRIVTAAAPLVQGRDGWLVPPFADGGQPALVMPGTVLRLVDDTPQVTVNGQPLSVLLTAPASPGRA